MEKRLLLAFVLSAAILLAWSVIFPPPQRPAAPEPVPAAESQEPAERRDDSADPPAPAKELAVVEEEEPIGPTDQVVEAAAEERVSLANAVMDVVISNRGAAVTSYRLLAYDGDDRGFAGQQRLHAVVQLRLAAFAAGHPEGRRFGVAEGVLAKMPKEGPVLGIRFRVSALDVIDAQAVEPLGNHQPVFEGKSRSVVS